MGNCIIFNNTYVFKFFSRLKQWAAPLRTFGEISVQPHSNLILFHMNGVETTMHNKWILTARFYIQEKLNSFRKFISMFVASNLKSPGARFSKVTIINGPSKLSPFTLKIEVFNSFASNVIKLSVNETKWSSLLNCQDPCSYSFYFDLNIWFRARKVIGTFEKRAPGHLKSYYPSLACTT